MSHAAVVVLAYSKEQAELLLAPYDESLQADEYQRPCSCVGLIAKARAAEHVKQVRGMDWNEERKTFNERHPENLKAETMEVRLACQKLWEEEVYFVRNKLEALFLTLSDDKDAPDPTCEDCKGTGKESTTYNPLSKHDYFQPIDNARDRYGKNWKLAMKPEEENDETDTTITFAIVTPMYGWQEKAKLGWFGTTHDDKDEGTWKALYWKAFNEAIELGMKPFVYDYHI
jgi:hypothetical protein